MWREICDVLFDRETYCRDRILPIAWIGTIQVGMLVWRNIHLALRDAKAFVELEDSCISQWCADELFCKVVKCPWGLKWHFTPQMYFISLWLRKSRPSFLSRLFLNITTLIDSPLTLRLQLKIGISLSFLRLCATTIYVCNLIYCSKLIYVLKMMWSNKLNITVCRTIFLRFGSVWNVSRMHFQRTALSLPHDVSSSASVYLEV